MSAVRFSGAFALALFTLGGATAIACSSFEGSSAAVGDGGAPEAAPEVDSSPGPIADAADDAPVDAGLPCTTTCASRQCSDAGSCYPLVFVTSGKFAGDLGGDAGVLSGDAICNAEALAAGRGGTFRAWLSTTQVDALERVTESAGADRPAIRADGVVIAASYHAMVNADGMDPGLAAPISKTALNADVPANDEIWTGTEVTGGQLNGSTCVDWTLASGNGHFGKASFTDKNWTDQDNASCAESHRLYCFELAR